MSSPELITYRLSLFSDPPASLPDEATSETFLKHYARFVLKFLWQNWDEEMWPKSIFDKTFLGSLLQKHHKTIPAFYNALIKDRDPFFLKATRLEVQASLNNLYAQLHREPPSAAQKKKVHLAINNILALYVMFSPSPFETLTVPQEDSDGQWQQVTFTIEPIELTPTQGPWLLFLGDKDRLFSYGFKPTTDWATPKLIHCGTGWPTAQGSAIQVLADIWPGKTPGEIFFDFQGNALKEWTAAQAPKKTDVIGHSLGGSIAMLMGMAYPEHINQAICLAPPGLTNQAYYRAHPLFGHRSRLTPSKKPPIIIQKPDFDPVSKCGEFMDDFTLVQSHVPEGEKWMVAARMFTAHAKNYPSHDLVTLKTTSMAIENESIHRAANNYWLYSRGRYFAFYCVLAPYFFIVRPLLGWISKNALPILLTSSLLIGCLIFPTFATALMSLPVLALLPSNGLTISLASHTVGYACSHLISFGFDLAFNAQLRTRQYINHLRALSIVSICTQIMYDLFNTISLGLLALTYTFVFHWIKSTIALLKHPRSDMASIHTLEHHQATTDLNDYPEHIMKDKLASAALVALFYLTAFPIKLLLIDLPTWFSSLCRASHQQLSTFKEKTIEPHIEASWLQKFIGYHKFGLFSQSKQLPLHDDTVLDYGEVSPLSGF